MKSFLKSTLNKNEDSSSFVFHMEKLPQTTNTLTYSEVAIIYEYIYEPQTKVTKEVQEKQSNSSLKARNRDGKYLFS